MSSPSARPARVIVTMAAITDLGTIALVVVPLLAVRLIPTA
jgi:hypothetical protein